MHLSVYFLTFFREGYLYYIYFILFLLSANGIVRMVHERSTGRERLFLTMGLIALSFYGIFDNKLAITGGTLVFLIGLIMIWSLDRNHAPGRFQTFGLLLLFSLALLIRADYPSLKLPSQNPSSEENAVVYLSENFEPGSRIVAYAPGFVNAARMEFVNIVSQGINFQSGAELHRWLVDNHIQAILSTSALRNSEPGLNRLIEENISRGLIQVFREDPHDIQILAVEDD
jgi:hypothetical protein